MCALGGRMPKATGTGRRRTADRPGDRRDTRRSWPVMADGTLDEAGPQGRHFRHAHAARQHAAVDALLGIADRAPLRTAERAPLRMAERAPLHMAERAPHWLAAPPLAEARMHPAD